MIFNDKWILKFDVKEVNGKFDVTIEMTDKDVMLDNYKLSFERIKKFYIKSIISDENISISLSKDQFIDSSLFNLNGVSVDLIGELKSLSKIIKTASADEFTLINNDGKITIAIKRDGKFFSVVNVEDYNDHFISIEFDEKYDSDSLILSDYYFHNNSSINTLNPGYKLGITDQGAGSLEYPGIIHRKINVDIENENDSKKTSLEFEVLLNDETNVKYDGELAVFADSDSQFLHNNISAIDTVKYYFDEDNYSSRVSDCSSGIIIGNAREYDISDENHKNAINEIIRYATEKYGTSLFIVDANNVESSQKNDGHIEKMEGFLGGKSLPKAEGFILRQTWGDHAKLIVNENDAIFSDFPYDQEGENRPDAELKMESIITNKKRKLNRLR